MEIEKAREIKQGIETLLKLKKINYEDFHVMIYDVGTSSFTPYISDKALMESIEELVLRVKNLKIRFLCSPDPIVGILNFEKELWVIYGLPFGLNVGLMLEYAVKNNQLDQDEVDDIYEDHPYLKLEIEVEP